VIAPMIPMFKAELAANPALLVEILKFSPLPARLVAVVENLMNKPPTPEAQRGEGNGEGRQGRRRSTRISPSPN
jgi:hypothetical protein